MPRILLSALIAICMSSTGLRIAYAKDLQEFEKGVLTHVLYHELGHALIREFGLPVLANEEAMADSFASVWITQKLRDDAPSIITSRARSWILEDSEFGPETYDFKSEHLLDIRRAYQAACILYGADPADWSHHVDWLEFTEDDLADCADTSPDQIDGWTSILEPLTYQYGNKDGAVETEYSSGEMATTVKRSGVLEMVADDARRFRWPNGIKFRYEQCNGGAYWSRSERTISLCESYVLRFIDQREILEINNK